MNKMAVTLSFLSICLAFVVVFLGYKAGLSPDAPPVSWTPEQQRELASKLKSAGVNQPAIRAYEQYASTASVDNKQLAGLAYTIGKMHMDAGNYEDALAWFYRVEIADPSTSLKADVGAKIISCLEHIGKYSAAEYALTKRTTSGQKPDHKGRTVVAEISGEKIYLEDLNEAFDSMPEWMRTQFEDPKKKAEFLKKYVADELLLRKAVKLEYDKDPQVRKQLKQIRRELLVNKVVEAELKDKIKVEPDDLQNYFEAHKKDYIEKEAVRVRLIKAGMQEIADTFLEKLKAGEDFAELAKKSLDKETAENGGKFNGWVRKGEDDLGIGNVDEVSRILFATNKGAITSSVEAGGYYYIFRVEEKRDEKTPEFTDVVERVKNDYYMQKLKISYQNLLDQILKSAEVKLFPEALTGEESS